MSLLILACLIAALVVFILAAIPVAVPKINLVALGLALFTLSFLLTRSVA